MPTGAAGSDACTGPCRSLIPNQFGHVVRANSATHSDGIAVSRGTASEWCSRRVVGPLEIVRWGDRDVSVRRPRSLGLVLELARNAARLLSYRCSRGFGMRLDDVVGVDANETRRWVAYPGRAILNLQTLLTRGGRGWLGRGYPCAR
jgi:hypothetical protein